MPNQKKKSMTRLLIFGFSTRQINEWCLLLVNTLHYITLYIEPNPVRLNFLYKQILFFLSFSFF